MDLTVGGSYCSNGHRKGEKKRKEKVKLNMYDNIRIYLICHEFIELKLLHF